MCQFKSHSLIFLSLLSSIHSQGDLPCTVNGKNIPDSVCEQGYWPNANSLINTNHWIPSRSTHYGQTSGGACGYLNTPNCYLPDVACSNVPNNIQSTLYAGQYAAPQGDYYSQLGDYLSCGECFELKCYDPNCDESVLNKSIVINIVDSCPCKPNQKWCCDKYSDCTELGPDNNGNPHCYVSNNGIWTNNSIHLDLSDTAYSMLTTGSKTGTPKSGIINSLIRRVSCPTVNESNVFIMFDESTKYNDNCYTVYPQPTKPCFQYLTMNIYNVRGYGGIQNISIYAGLIENNELIYKQFGINHIPATAGEDQEQYGNYVGPSNKEIYFPIQFTITDRGGRNVSTTSIANFSQGVPTWYAIGVQFHDVTL